MKFLFVKSHSRCVLSIFIAIIPTLFINLVFCYPPAKPPSNPKLSPYSPTMEQELKRFGKAVAISDGDEEESYVILSDTCRRDMRSKKGVLCQPEKDVNECSPSTQLDADELTEEESDNSGASKYFRRGRKLEKELSYPTIPQLRRKRIPWTTAEDEILKVKISFNAYDQYSIPLCVLCSSTGQMDTCNSLPNRRHQRSSGSSPFSWSLQWIRTNYIGGTLRSGSQRQLSPVFRTRGGSSVLSTKLAGLQSTHQQISEFPGVNHELKRFQKSGVGSDYKEKRRTQGFIAFSPLCRLPQWRNFNLSLGQSSLGRRRLFSPESQGQAPPGFQQLPAGFSPQQFHSPRSENTGNGYLNPCAWQRVCSCTTLSTRSVRYTDLINLALGLAHPVLLTHHDSGPSENRRMMIPRIWPLVHQAQIPNCLSLSSKLLGGLVNVIFLFIKREANCVAHVLARYAATACVCMGEVPSFVKSFVNVVFMI